MTGWLDQPELEVAGVDAAVVGREVADEVAALARRGCGVTALDLAAGDVDLFDLPDEWRGAFGLVVDVGVGPTLPADRRDTAMQSVASLVGPGGYLVVTLLLATSDTASRTWDGPPWALAPSELAAYAAAGLERVGLDHPPVGEDEPAMEVRLVMRRPA